MDTVKDLVIATEDIASREYLTLEKQNESIKDLCDNIDFLLKYVKDTALLEVVYQLKDAINKVC